MMMNKNIMLILLLAWANPLWSCAILNSQRSPISEQQDGLFQLLSREAVCPSNVIAFKQILSKAGLHTAPSMVANRGRHNAKLGSFSLFETVTGRLAGGEVIGRGEFFFGHFTTSEGGEVILDQQPLSGKLLIELIAWDPYKKLFNFYELVGGDWFFRGDSLDALKDNKLVHRKLKAGENKFGNRMRCSACHSSGGPIMKELAFPHNDWATSKRPLEFSPNTISAELGLYVKLIRDASHFSADVKLGIEKLEKSYTYQSNRSRLSWQEQLRPLFCENEINLESALQPLAAGRSIQIPSSSVISPLLAQAKAVVSNGDYLSFLHRFQLRFPETNMRDSDHGWLTPVKGYSDLLSIKSLVQKGIVSEEFVSDVLGVDFKHPTFSATRCGLLKLVPETGSNWKANFLTNLQSSPLPQARELLENINSVEKTKTWHQQRVKVYLEDLDSTSAFTQLLDDRAKLLQSEISANPRGQILEPGFRVVFPVSLKIPNK